jgi:MFS family permease
VNGGRNVFLLACCQALLLSISVTLVSINALAGFALAPSKALATLPITTGVIGVALAAFPASLWCKRVGWRRGFLTGATFGLAGAVVSTLGLRAGSFAMLCAGTFLHGFHQAFGQYYRFAAAEAVSAATRPRAIALVLAGGLAGGLVAPALSRRTVDLLPTRFLASYASLAGFCLLTMLLAGFLRLSSSPEEVQRGSARPLREILVQPVFVVAAASGALGYTVMNLLMTATPLAMAFCGHGFGASAGVISAHVVAMFAPSFFTGSLIQRTGALKVILAGVALMSGCVAVALSGQHVGHFWWALVLLGVGWNFMYVGGTTLLTEAYRPAEKAKVQGANEILVFGMMTLSSFTSGVLVNAFGWRLINLLAVPLLALAALAAGWLLRRRGRAAAA